MRLGLLGLGRIGAFHAETLTSLPAVDSLVVSDPVPRRAAGIAEQFGAQVADTPGALLASGSTASSSRRLPRPTRNSCC